MINGVNFDLRKCEPEVMREVGEGEEREDLDGWACRQEVDDVCEERKA